MTSNGRDPFPLFHLAPLNFPCSPESIPALPSYQLALAPFSSEWDEKLEPLIKSTFRRRRERVRAEIASRVPMGVYSSIEERQREVFPKFEMIDLTFDLKNLEGLTSAQLAAVAFHPESSKQIRMEAEDIFFRRRERDIVAGLALRHYQIPRAPSLIAPLSHELSQSQSPDSAAFTSSHATDHAIASRSSRPLLQAARSPLLEPTASPPAAASHTLFGLPGLQSTTSALHFSYPLPDYSPPPPPYSSRHSDSISCRRNPHENSGNDLEVGKVDRQKQAIEPKERGRGGEYNSGVRRQSGSGRNSGKRGTNRIGFDPDRSHDRWAPVNVTKAHGRESVSKRKRERSPDEWRTFDLPERRRRVDNLAHDSRVQLEETDHLIFSSQTRKNEQIRKSSPSPAASNWIPLSIQAHFHTLLIGYFHPGDSMEESVLDFVDYVIPGLKPIAVKVVRQSKPNNSATFGNRQGYYYAFAAFENRSDADLLMRRSTKLFWKGCKMRVSMGRQKTTSEWYWWQLSADFVEKLSEEEVRGLAPTPTLNLPTRPRRSLDSSKLDRDSSKQYTSSPSDTPPSIATSCSLLPPTTVLAALQAGINPIELAHLAHNNIDLASLKPQAVEAGASTETHLMKTVDPRNRPSSKIVVPLSPKPPQVVTEPSSSEPSSANYRYNLPLPVRNVLSSLFPSPVLQEEVGSKFVTDLARNSTGISNPAVHNAVATANVGEGGGATFENPLSHASSSSCDLDSLPLTSLPATMEGPANDSDRSSPNSELVDLKEEGSEGKLE
ncbi:hypothetical protein JCM3765_007433 [Sporobolomyces pararoseus]